MQTIKLKQYRKGKTNIVTVVYKPRKRTVEPHQLFIGGSINLSVKTSLCTSGCVTRKRKSALVINRETKHENVFYSDSTCTYGFWFFSLIDGQFVTETGYRQPSTARQALSKIINSEMKELKFKNEEIY